MNDGKTKDSRGSSRLIAKVRIRDMERIIINRYSGMVPNNGDGVMIIKFVAHHAASISENAEKWVKEWAGRWAPWLLSHESRDQIVRDAAANPVMLSADELAVQLGVTKEERDWLGITTIGAIDCDKNQRSELRRERKRRRIEAQRRADGAVPRDQYESESLSRTKPWEAMGVSRSTWYRQKQ